MGIIKSRPRARNAHLEQNMSAELQDLLNQMLEKDPIMRPDAAQCLTHAFFKKYDVVPKTLSVGVLQCLEAYSKESELKKAIFLLMAHQCAEPALQELQAIFTYFDTGNSGALPRNDLNSLLQRSGFGTARCDAIVRALDRDNSRDISWTEFCAAVLCQKLSRDERLIEAAFATFQHEENASLSQQDFERILAKGDEQARKQWQKALPSQIAAMRCTSDKKPQRGLGGTLKRLIEGCISAPAEVTVTKQEFHDFVGRRLEVKPGSGVNPITQSERQF